MNKLKIWNQYEKWDDAERAWDEGAQEAAKQCKVQTLTTLPKMIGITPETAKLLKWKSLKWMVWKDTGGRVFKAFLKHPFTYAWRYLKSIVRRKSYVRKGDFFFYGIETPEQFEKLLTDHDSLFVLGFSYCHKPFECPSGRFTSDCIHDATHPVCRQCFIGKAVHALPEQNASVLFIPTVHYVAEKILEIMHNNPKKQIIFLITACEMTLKMFSDWGNMAGIKGVGVRLDGRICNTMKAFELSEQGIKPGLTVVLEDTQKQMLAWIKLRRWFGFF